MSAPSARPRLGQHVRPRRHLLAGGSRVVLHDETRGQALGLGEREWAVLCGLDGTRDHEGIRLAAAARGVRVSAAHVSAFVAQLAGLGLLEDEEAGARSREEPARARDKPIAPLPEWGLSCDGRGTCCRTFATILFTPLEVARACATLPDHHGAGADADALFTPEAGLDRTLFAGALEEGRCTYLHESGRCALHAAGGPSAKPAGCRTFPLRFLDVGTEIRVAPRVECACVLVPSREAPVAARRGSELDPAIYVPALGPLQIGRTVVAPSEALAWLAALPDATDDAATLCEALAEGLSHVGLDASIEARPPAPDATRIANLQARAGRLADRRAELGAREDLVAAVATRITRATPSPDDPPVAGEALLLRALRWAPPDDAPLEETLRRAAARIRLARALPDLEAPLALVEALCRGHGLD